MHDLENHLESCSQSYSTAIDRVSQRYAIRFLNTAHLDSIPCRRQVEVDNWQFAWAEEQKVACCKTVGWGTQLQRSWMFLVSVRGLFGFFPEELAAKTMKWTFQSHQRLITSSTAQRRGTV